MLNCGISSEPSQPGNWCGTYHEVNVSEFEVSMIVDDI
jgi:hypothetical protein